MPLYEYQCSDCDQVTETLQRLSDPPLTECPHCGGAMKKLLSAPAFQFKGSGWYVTDYARKGQGDGKPGDGKAGDGKPGDAKPAKSGGDDASSSGSDSAPKTDSKTGSKSEKKSASAGDSSTD